MRSLSSIVVCLIILFQPSVSKAEEIVLSYAQWKPIFYIDDAGEVVGIYKEILDAVFVEGLGMTVSYDELPWSRAQKS